ncbi:MAG: hypothetical protein ACK2VA_21535 [Anaerolineae bacterium]
MTAIYAGAAVRTITPDHDAGPVYLAGFQANRPATGVHDDLHVRALALRVGEDTPPFLLAVCDLIGLLHADVKNIRQAAAEGGLDPTALVVTCTHVHSGPDTIGMWGRSRLRSGVDPDYVAYVQCQVVDALAAAVRDVRPAHLCAGKTQMTAWLKNAREPGIVDREMSVLQALDEDNEPIFTLINLACHPEVMFGENTQVTADYAGAACQALEAEAGGTAVFASADIGGMMTPDVAQGDRTFETVERMGRDVAAAALSALAHAEPVAPAAARFIRREVRVPLDNPLFKRAISIGVLSRLGLDSDGCVVTEVSLLDLGPARLITVPGELLPEPGMHLRAALGVPYRFLIGLADDELGYLLPSHAYIYPPNPLCPGDHYEETMSVSRYALPLLAEAWLALLADVEPEEGLP